MDGLTLITESERANDIASKFSLAHENSLHSDQSASVQDSCSAREIKNIIKKLKNGKAPGGDVVSNILLKNIPPLQKKSWSFIKTILSFFLFKIR
jgi:hypothetical protein